MADGFGHGGAPAGAAAIDALKHLETDGFAAGSLLNALEDAVERADIAVRGPHEVRGVREAPGSGPGNSASPSPDEAGTTVVTAMLWTGSLLALATSVRPASHDARPGDRYLLCSDGLTTVVPTDDIRQVITTADGPERAVRELVALANRSGGPDNVSCVVADVVPAPGPQAPAARAM